MKKIFCLLFTALTLFSLAACSGSESKTYTTETVVSKTDTTDNSESNTPAAGISKKTEGVDVDLTAMSSTMVYSEVLNMQQHPENYLGKIVKMKGAFNVSEVDDNRYFACIIKDATACCAQGIEFTWAGDHTYPDDYPEANTEITVIGTFNTYMEGNSKYLQLKDSEVQF